MAYPRFLRARSHKFAVGSLAGDYTTASTTFVDIDAAYSFTLAAEVGDVLEMCITGTAVGAALLRVDFAWNVAGNDLTPYLDYDVATNPIPFCARVLYTVQSGDITSGKVTAKARMKTSTSTLSVQNSSSRGPVASVRNIGPADPN